MEKSFLTIIRRHPPVTADEMPREKLFRLLDRAGKRPLIWICGPPGSGKTSLVRGYIESRGIDSIWFQVSGITHREPRPEPTAIESGNTGLNPASGDPEFDPLSGMSVMFQHSSPAQVPVIDDFHLLGEDDPIRRHILTAISSRCGTLPVIVIGRHQPPPAMYRSIPRERIYLFHPGLLRLSLNEIREFTSGSGLSDEAQLRLLDITHGWITGVRLLMDTIKVDDIGTRLSYKNIPKALLHYFSRELFQGIDMKIRDFLIRTAFLPLMTPRSVQQLTGYPDAPDILTELFRKNCFVEKIRFSTTAVYRYEPLAGHFLKWCAKHTIPAGTRMILRGRATEFFTTISVPEQAARFLADSHEWESLQMLILKQAPVFYAHGNIPRVRQWIDVLPQHLTGTIPRLMYWSGICRLSSSPDAALACFQRALEEFKLLCDPEGTLQSFTGILDSIFFGFRDLSWLDPWIDEIETLYHPDIPGISRGSRASLAARMSLGLLLRRPGHPRLDRWAQHALQQASRQGIPCETALNWGYLTWYYMLSGDIEHAHFANRQMIQLSLRHELPPETRLFIGFAQSLFYQLEGCHDQCRDIVSSCLAISRSAGIHSLDAMLLGQLVSSALNSNDIRSAETYLEQMNAVLGHERSWELSLYYFLKSRLCIMQEDYRQAGSDIEISMKFARDFGSPFIICIRHLAKANILFHMKRYSESSHHVREACDIASESISDLLKFNTGIAASLFLSDPDGNGICRDALESALRIGKTRRYLVTHLDCPQGTETLCTAALEAGIEVDYVRDIIRRRNVMPDSPPQHLSDWPWHVKVHTFRRFSVLIDEAPIQFSHKSQKKPLELLKVLIAFGGRAVPEDAVTDVLWPDSDGDTSHQSLTITLHRLRKLLRRPDAVELKYGRLTINPRHCWIDVWAFKRILNMAEAAWNNPASSIRGKDAVEWTKRAIDMYRGPFLADEPSSACLITMRNKLSDKYVRAVSRLGVYLEKQGRCEEAAWYYQNAVAAEPLTEFFYKRLMVCFQRIDRRDEALCVYDRCRFMLSEHYGISPSPETEAIRKAVLCR